MRQYIENILPYYSKYERAAAFFSVLWAFQPSGPVSVFAGFAAGCLMVAGHARIQIAPLFLSTFAAALYMFPWVVQFIETGPDWSIFAWRACVICGTILAAILHSVAPIRTLPPYTGKYHVGAQDAWVSRAGMRLRIRLMYPLAPTRAAVHPPYLLHGVNSVKGVAAYKGMWWPLFTAAVHTQVHHWSDRDGQPPPTSGATPVPPPYPGPDGPAEARRAPAAGHPELPAASSPVMVFSHGLAAGPELYSALCSELASHGWLVLMVEHPDGSAAYAQPEQNGTGLPYEPLTAEEKEHVGLQWERRNVQLQERTKDVGCMLQLLAEWFQYPEDIQAGRTTAQYDPSLDFIRYVVALHGDSSAVWLGGHSFGAATCLEVAAQSEHPTLVAPSLSPPGLDRGEAKKIQGAQQGLVAQRAPIAGVIALDPWGFPISPTTVAHGLPNTPVFAVLGKQFSSPTDLPSNYGTLRLLLHAETRELVAQAHQRSSSGSNGVHIAHVALGAELPDAAEESDEEGSHPTEPAHGWREHGSGVDARGFWRPSPDLQLQLKPGASPSTLLIAMDGLQHLDFSDVPFLAAKSMLGDGTGKDMVPELVTPWLGACIRQFTKQATQDAGPVRGEVKPGRTMVGGLPVPKFGGGGVRTAKSARAASAVLALESMAKHPGLAPREL